MPAGIKIKEPRISRIGTNKRALHSCIFVAKTFEAGDTLHNENKITPSKQLARTPAFGDLQN